LRVYNQVTAGPGYTTGRLSIINERCEHQLATIVNNHLTRV